MRRYLDLDGLDGVTLFSPDVEAETAGPLMYRPAWDTVQDKTEKQELSPFLEAAGHQSELTPSEAGPRPRVFGEASQPPRLTSGTATPPPRVFGGGEPGLPPFVAHGAAPPMEGVSSMPLPRPRLEAPPLVPMEERDDSQAPEPPPVGSEAARLTDPIHRLAVSTQSLGRLPTTSAPPDVEPGELAVGGALAKAAARVAAVAEEEADAEPTVVDEEPGPGSEAWVESGDEAGPLRTEPGFPEMVLVGAEDLVEPPPMAGVAADVPEVAAADELARSQPLAKNAPDDAGVEKPALAPVTAAGVAAPEDQTAGVASDAGAASARDKGSRSRRSAKRAPADAGSKNAARAGGASDQKAAGGAPDGRAASTQGDRTRSRRSTKRSRAAAGAKRAAQPPAKAAAAPIKATDRPTAEVQPPLAEAPERRRSRAAWLVWAALVTLAVALYLMWSRREAPVPVAGTGPGAKSDPVVAARGATHLAPSDSPTKVTAKRGASAVDGPPSSSVDSDPAIRGTDRPQPPTPTGPAGAVPAVEPSTPPTAGVVPAVEPSTPPTAGVVPAVEPSTPPTAGEKPVGSLAGVEEPIGPSTPSTGDTAPTGSQAERVPPVEPPGLPGADAKLAGAARPIERTTPPSVDAKPAGSLAGAALPVERSTEAGAGGSLTGAVEPGEPQRPPGIDAKRAGALAGVAQPVEPPTLPAADAKPIDPPAGVPQPVEPTTPQIAPSKPAPPPVATAPERPGRPVVAPPSAPARLARRPAAGEAGRSPVKSSVPFPGRFGVKSTAPVRISDQALRELIGKLQACQGPVEVVGHTCALGSADYNHRLGLKRATAVRDVLVRRGLPAERIRVRSKGSLEPVAGNNDESGRRRNRRVTVSCPSG